MAESYVQVSEGTGKKLWTETTVVGADTKHAEIVKLGEPYLPSYTVTTANVTNVSVASANSHLFQIMAGSTLMLRIRRILIVQAALATTATIGAISIARLT